MSLVAVATLAATVAGAAAFVWTVYLLLDVGSDSHAAGPWRRPEPTRRPTRLPADFVGLWSLFGQRSMRDYAGSWEAAVSRLDRLEASLLEAQAGNGDRSTRHTVPPPHPARSSRRAADPAEEWLHRRLDRLEALAGLTGPADDRDPASKPTS